MTLSREKARLKTVGADVRRCHKADALTGGQGTGERLNKKERDVCRQTTRQISRSATSPKKQILQRTATS